MALTTTISSTVQVQDTVTNNFILNKTLAAFSFSGSIAAVAESISVGTGTTTVSLPLSPTQIIYIRDTHPTQTLEVSWTPNGGSSNVVITLQPNGFILVGEPNTTSGITTLTLNGSGAGTTVEYVLVG